MKVQKSKIVVATNQTALNQVTKAHLETLNPDAALLTIDNLEAQELLVWEYDNRPHDMYDECKTLSVFVSQDSVNWCGENPHPT